MLSLGSKSLRDKSGVGTIDDEIQDNAVMKGVSYFSQCFSPSPCEITSGGKRSMRNDVISRNHKQSNLLFSRLLIIASLFIVFTCKKMEKYFWKRQLLETTAIFVLKM